MKTYAIYEPTSGKVIGFYSGGFPELQTQDPITGEEVLDFLEITARTQHAADWQVIAGQLTPTTK